MIRVVQPSFAGTAILAAILVLTCSTRAQERSLITQPVDPTHLTRLAGNTHPLALAKYDQGAAPSSLVMNHLFLVLKRSPSQESALDTLLEQSRIKNRRTITSGSRPSNTAFSTARPKPTSKKSKRGFLHRASP
jgi:hypothetical protein